MFSPPPELITITIHSTNANIMVDFYEELGMLLAKHKDNKNLEKSYVFNNLSIEIIPVQSDAEQTSNLRLKFYIDEITGYLECLEKYGCRIIEPLWETELTQHIVISDPNINLIELETKIYKRF